MLKNNIVQLTDQMPYHQVPVNEVSDSVSLAFWDLPVTSEVKKNKKKIF